MNVLRSIIHDNEGSNLIEKDLRDLSHKCFMAFILQDPTYTELQFAFEDFKSKALNINHYNYYVDNVYMYINELGINIVIDIKHMIKIKSYRFNIKLGR